MGLRVLDYGVTSFWQMAPVAPRSGIHRLAEHSKYAAVTLVFALIFRMGPALAERAENTIPAISETVVMLYYKDITVAAAFYGETLGLETTHSQEFAKLFRLTPTSLVGVIREGETSYNKAQATNAVMLSVVTPDVDAWYARLRRQNGVKILKPIADSTNNPIRAFLIEDPGGYTIEFFSWLNTVDSKASK